jgi:hypothetical protein
MQDWGRLKRRWGAKGIGKSWFVAGLFPVVLHFSKKQHAVFG